MSYNATNPVVVGQATKKDHYDRLFDNVLAQSAALKHVVAGRITLASGTPVTTTDQSAKTTVYFTPYGGDCIWLYNGSVWVPATFVEQSLSLGTDATNTNYDLFGYLSGSTLAIERLAWTNDTTRATALTVVSGMLVKNGDTTRRYLGSYRTTGSGQTSDTVLLRYVWNYYNRRPRQMLYSEATNSYTYTIAVWRQFNGSSAAQVSVLVGWAEDPVEVHTQGAFTNTTAGCAAAVGCGYDSNTPFGETAGQHLGRSVAQIASGGTLYYSPTIAHGVHYPAVGKHDYRACEYSEAIGTTTWYGDNGGADIGPRAGLVGVIWG